MKSNDVVVAWFRVPLPIGAFQDIDRLLTTIYGPGLRIRQPDMKGFEVIRPGSEMAVEDMRDPE